MTAVLRQRSTPAVEAFLVGLLVLICLVSGIGLSPILNGDEAQFAQASREKDFHRGFQKAVDIPFEVVERVEGLDLGHGRQAATVFFQLREDR